MYNSKSGLRKAAIISSCLLIATPLTSQAEDNPQLFSPLYSGGYAAPLASYVLTDKQLAKDDSIGGIMALGYRQQHWALELSGIYTRLSANNDSDPKLAGATLGTLIFPFTKMPNLYVAAAAGGGEINRYQGNQSFNLVTLDFGIGHLFALVSERYEWAIRTEVRYRLDRREADITDLPNASIDAPRRFNDVLINIGLQLPFGKKTAAAPPPPPAEVVAPLRICADGQDNDGDGQADYPSDPGCSTPDDIDESDA